MAWDEQASIHGADQHHVMYSITMLVHIRLLIALFWPAAFTAPAVAGTDTCSQAGTNGRQSSGSYGPTSRRNPSASIDCAGQVLLFDRLPILPMQPTSNGGVPSTSMLEEHPVVFAKTSRFHGQTLDSQDMIANRLLHISPNGDHMGWYVYVPSEECLREVKQIVAREITASSINGRYAHNDLLHAVDRRGPHKLVDEEGKAYPQHSGSPRLHLLLPRESFVHEAVEEGYVRILSDGMALKTMSMTPRVFVVDPILGKTECAELIEVSSVNFHRSEETHYSPGFENYRTSLSGNTPRSSKVAQKLWQRVVNITGMPEDGVEFPQLIKYETNVSWYKAHLDYFHTYQSKPLEELRVFVSTRAEELLRLAIKEISDILDAGSYERFDTNHSIMGFNIASRLASDLKLQQIDGISDKRLLLHHHLRRLEDPKRLFSLAGIHLAAQLLEANGASDPFLLAEKYFSFDGHHGRTALELGVEDYVPYFCKPVEFNRHVTVLPILEQAEKGGHTAFPFSTSSLGIDPAEGETIQECKRGLILKPSAGQALLFYNRLPTGEKDEKSEHAGCSVQQGLKHAANCFTWNVDQMLAWRFQMKADELYE